MSSGMGWDMTGPISVEDLAQLRNEYQDKELAARRAAHAAVGSGERDEVTGPDVFSANPLVDEVRASDPEGYRRALAGGPPPTLFESGDLPAFTASGIDPAVLRRLPWSARHRAAATRDRAEVYRLVELASADPAGLEYEYGGDPANGWYAARVAVWRAGMGGTRRVVS